MPENGLKELHETVAGLYGQYCAHRSCARLVARLSDLQNRSRSHPQASEQLQQHP